MSEAAAIPQAYADQFQALSAQAEPDWLQDLRRQGFERLTAAGFPGRRDERWRYTDVKALTRDTFPPVTAPGALPADLVVPFPALDAIRVVFADGALDPSRSDLAQLPEGLSVRPLDAAFAADASGALAERLLHTAEDNGFTALNAALLKHGAVIEVAAGKHIDKPLHLVFVNVGREQAVSTHPRLLVQVGKGAALTLVESHIASGENTNFSNLVSDMVLDANAELRHCLHQDIGTRAYHIEHVKAVLARDSRLCTHSICLGGRVLRNDIDCHLDDTGAEVLLDGLFMAAGREHVDNHTTVRHHSPHTRSEEYYKGVLDGRGRGVFDGRVVVHPHAQKIEAHQSNPNLLLSPHAEIDTKPQLEIYADDVKCSHGSTVGQLDPDALFYLRSRGMSADTARNLLIYAFAEDMIERLPLAQLRDDLARRASGRLPGAPNLRGLL